MAKKAKPKGRSKRVEWKLLQWTGCDARGDETLVCHGEVSVVSPAMDVNPLLVIIEKNYQGDIQEFFDNLSCPPDDLENYGFVLVWKLADGTVGAKKINLKVEMELKFELTDKGNG